MSSSAHSNNKNINILILGEGITRGLHDATLVSEKNYLINFTATRKNFCLSLHFMEQIVIYLLTAQKLLNSKQKIF